MVVFDKLFNPTAQQNGGLQKTHQGIYEEEHCARLIATGLSQKKQAKRYGREASFFPPSLRACRILFPQTAGVTTSGTQKVGSGGCGKGRNNNKLFFSFSPPPSSPLPRVPHPLCVRHGACIGRNPCVVTGAPKMLQLKGDPSFSSFSSFPSLCFPLFFPSFVRPSFLPPFLWPPLLFQISTFFITKLGGRRKWGE